MANTKDFFHGVAQRILSNWTALKIAVEHGFGERDYAVELPSYMTETFYTNDNPTTDDIAGVLEEYMDNYFNTELDDNSSTQVAEHMCKFYRYCLEGNETIAIAEKEKLPALQTWILSRDELRQMGVREPIIIVNESDDDSESDEADEDVGNKMEDDDWVEVKPRRKNTINATNLLCKQKNE
ncbi:pre-rRNA-processing protein TSR2 homolog isoform X2 [Aphidius gifuensis]|uniref:pre-rRNA-processing protein TSR2 homolog isoform X2 n=1 Tax=Aphidius gifuensis TaxID=684658 RepID=UPI001CDCF598|nr:pre-rRNA-processing protein TSR2 homolog isoform X2 [Aphidius gifuensis]